MNHSAKTLKNDREDDSTLRVIQTLREAITLATGFLPTLKELHAHYMATRATTDGSGKA